MKDTIPTIVDWVQTHLGPERSWDILLTLLAWGVVVGARVVVGHMLGKRVGDVQRRYLAKKTVNYLISFAFVVVTLVIWFGGLTGWSAYLGLVSAGLAIALQDPLVNLAGWVFKQATANFTAEDGIDFAYPTTRYYDNRAEGKPGAGGPPRTP